MRWEASTLSTGRRLIDRSSARCQGRRIHTLEATNATSIPMNCHCTPISALDPVFIRKMPMHVPMTLGTVSISSSR